MLRTFARVASFSLVAAVFTVPTLSASQAAAPGHVQWKDGTSSHRTGATLSSANKIGGKLGVATYGTPTYSDVILTPSAADGKYISISPTAWGYFNDVSPSSERFAGGVTMKLGSGQTVQGRPGGATWAGTQQDGLLIMKITDPAHYNPADMNDNVTPDTSIYKCYRYGDLFTTSDNTHDALSNSPVLYDPALAGKLVAYSTISDADVTNSGRYSEGRTGGLDYTTNHDCDGAALLPRDNNEAGVSGNLYYAGLSANADYMASLDRLGSAGLSISWASTNSESLTVISVGQQTGAQGDWGLFSNKFNSLATPVAKVCMAAKDLSASAIKLSDLGVIGDSNTVMEVAVYSQAYNSGIGCQTQYESAFTINNGNWISPVEWMDYQLPLWSTSTDEVAINGTLNFNFPTRGVSTYIDDLGFQWAVSDDGVNFYEGGGGGAVGSFYWNYSESVTSWVDLSPYAGLDYPMGCQYPNGIWLRLMNFPDPSTVPGTFPNLGWPDLNHPYVGFPEDPSSQNVQAIYYHDVHFLPQSSSVCGDANPIGVTFAGSSIDTNTITHTGNDYSVTMPLGDDTVDFTPSVNNGGITPSWYNDQQGIETITVNGEVYTGGMPVPVDTSNGPVTVDYYVVSPDGLQSTHVSYTFYPHGYVPGPDLTSVTSGDGSSLPAKGPVSGGTVLTIVGGPFVIDTTTPSSPVYPLVEIVDKFDGTDCTVTAATSTTLTCTPGAWATPGVYNVYVANPGVGSSWSTAVNAFQYISAPTIDSTTVSPVAGITPNHGPMVGGTLIEITGTGFYGHPTITVNGIPCAFDSRSGDTNLYCVTGAGPAGLGNVVVTNEDSGTATAVNAYTYEGPTIGSIDPNHGPIAGGTTITITGTGFAVGTTITVGGAPCTAVNIISATQVTCVTADHAAGAVDVVVTVPAFGTTTSSGGFTYDGPTAPNIVYNKDIIAAGITLPSGVTVNPAANPAQGVGIIGINDVVVHVPFGTNITALPFNFTITAPDVMLVGPVVQMSGVTKNNFTTPVTYTVTAPDGTTKNYTVTVVVDPAPAGTPTTTPTTPTTPAPAVDALSVGGVTPKAGPVTGGTTVTVSGTGFTSGTTVTLGGAACSPVTVISSTQISCVTAAHVAGVVDVVVSDAGKSATAAGAYTYADGTVQLGPLPANAGLQPGTTYVTVDGTPYQINVAPNGDANAIQLTASDWNLKLQAKGENGQPLALDDQNRIIVNPGLAAAFTGTGFMPNSDVYVYAFSDPKFMGVIRTDANGNFTSSLKVPDLMTGGHTIQLNGLSPKGEVRSASVGVVVQPKITIASGKVYFAYASSVLDAKSKATLAAIAAKAKAAKGNVFITVVGWAQPTANSKRHVALSNARATAVASALKAAGVKGAYSVTGKGLAAANVASSRYAEITVQVARK